MEFIVIIIKVMFIEICLPILNEERILKKNTLQLLDYCRRQKFDFNWKIVIVNNGSTDKSSEISEKLVEKYPHRIKHVYIDRPGRGRALKQYWLSSKSDIFVYMDMDLAVDLKHIKELFKYLGGDYKMVIGSRLLPESKIERPFLRELTSQTYNLFCRMILGYKFSDLQCGFKSIDRKTFFEIAPYIKGTHWFFDSEMVILCKHFGHKVKEIPVIWRENRYNQRESKVNIIRDSCVYLFAVFSFRRRLNKIKKDRN